MKPFNISLLLSLVVCFLCSAPSAKSQFTMQKNVLGCGGSQTSNGQFLLQATVGQAVIGRTANTLFSASIGFWFRTTTMVSIRDEGKSARTIYEYRFDGVFPNPFSIADAGTNVRFSLPYRSALALKIFDATGREVMNVVEDVLDAGTYSMKVHSMNWNAGIYLCHMRATPTDNVSARQITLMWKMIFVR